MRKRKAGEVCKGMLVISIMVAIFILLVAYQSGGLIRLVLAASLGIFAFKMHECDFRDFCMVILCAIVITLTTRENDLSYGVITFGMLYAGVAGAFAIYQE